MNMFQNRRIHRLARGLAAIAVTTISIVGSNVRTGISQDAGQEPADSDPAVKKPIAVPSVEPAALSEPVPAQPDAAKLKATPAAPAKKPAIQDPADPLAAPNSTTVPAAGATINITENPTAKREQSSASDSERIRILEKQLIELTSELRALRGEKKVGTTVYPKPLAPTPDPQSPRLTEAKPAAKPRASAQRLQIIDDDIPVDSSSRSGTRKTYSSVPIPPSASLAPNVNYTQVPNIAVAVANPNVQSITITRSTYKLPPGRAEALAKLLTEQLIDDIEFKVKGDSLQVTASPDDQQAIERLIGLIQRKGRPPVRRPSLDDDSNG